MRRSILSANICLALALAGVPALAAPTHVWVDSHWSGQSCGGHSWKVDAFSTIQDGVTAVAIGGRVDVAAGTYKGKVIIDHSLTLAGPMADVSPNDPAPADPCQASDKRLDPAKEAVIVPADLTVLPQIGVTKRPSPNLSLPGAILVEVAADNVTVEGLTVDGNNPQRLDYIPVNSSSTTQAVGICADGRNIQGSIVRDNIVRNFELAGIYFKTLGKWSLGNRIADNRIDNMPIRTDSVPYLTPDAVTASGIRVAQEWYGDIEGNTITRAAVGIHLSNFTSALSEGDGAQPSPVVKNNQIQAYYDGMIVNLVFDHFYSGPYLILANNDITMLPDSSPDHPNRYGLCLLGVHGSSRVVAIGNKISGGEAGVYCWNNGPRAVNPPIEIDRGSIVDAKYGVWVTNSSPFGYPEADSTVFIHGTFIRRCDTGVFVEDNPKAKFGVTVVMSDGARIFGGKTGILLKGGRANLQLLPAYCSVQLTGQSGDYITLAGNGETYPGDLSIASALFGGGEDYHQAKHPTKMSPDELKALDAKITDKLDDPKLGRVQ